MMNHQYIIVITHAGLSHPALGATCHTNLKKCVECAYAFVKKFADLNEIELEITEDELYLEILTDGEYYEEGGFDILLTLDTYDFS